MSEFEWTKAEANEGAIVDYSEQAGSRGGGLRVRVVLARDPRGADQGGLGCGRGQRPAKPARSGSRVQTRCCGWRRPWRDAEPARELFSRRLAGWSIAEHMRTDLVTDALKAAAATRGGDLQGAIFHSDNGAQYVSKQFAELCDTLGVTRSRGAVGTSADNAAAEAFNSSLKRETLQGAKRWPGARAARLAVFRWVNRYNTRRRHSTLGNRSPVDYEHRSLP
jgi:transposase InsO family protein